MLTKIIYLIIKKILDDAVKIGDQWKSIEDVDINKLAKSTFTVSDPSDM